MTKKLSNVLQNNEMARARFVCLVTLLPYILVGFTGIGMKWLKFFGNYTGTRLYWGELEWPRNRVWALVCYPSLKGISKQNSSDIT